MRIYLEDSTLRLIRSELEKIKHESPAKELQAAGEGRALPNTYALREGIAQAMLRKDGRIADGILSLLQQIEEEASQTC